jgi:hypothetical protein
MNQNLYYLPYPAILLNIVNHPNLHLSYEFHLARLLKKILTSIRYFLITIYQHRKFNNLLAS